MVLLKAGIAIAILAAIMYAWKRKQEKRKETEGTEELLKIEEEFLASMANEKESKIFTMSDIDEEPKDERDNWEPMKIQFEEEHKCNCGHCHHKEEEHECCGKCHEEEHECSGECDGCNHCEMEMIEEDSDVIADRIVFVNDGSSSSNKYHKAADSHGMDGAIKMSETEALEKGFVPCARCFGKCKK